MQFFINELQVTLQKVYSKLVRAHPKHKLHSLSRKKNKHIPISHTVKSYKCMLHTVFATHVARGTEVIVVALCTLPPHAIYSLILTTHITSNARMYNS